MIEFNDKAKSFILTGKNYTYAMYVNRTGYLQHLYYGTKIDTVDIEFLVKEHGERFSPDPKDLNADMTTDGMPSEIGSFGRGDFRQATVIVKRSDGAAMSAFKYVRHKIYDGAPKVKGMP